MMVAAVAAAVTAGFVSTAHCAVMCGPLALYAGTDRQSAFGYHAARLVAYGLAGIAAGSAGTFIENALPLRWAGAITSGMLALALLLLAQRLSKEKTKEPGLVVLRTRSTQVARRFLRLPKNPVLVGALTALLPCGTLYSALLIASGSGGGFGGALSMIVFGSSSSLGLGAVAFASTRVRSHPAFWERTWIRSAFIVILIVGAVMLLARVASTLSTDSGTACCTIHR